MTFTTTVGRHTSPFALRLQLFTLAAATAWSTIASPTFARTEVVARLGDKIPLPGNELTLTTIRNGVLNDSGQIAFQGDGTVPGAPQFQDNFAVVTGVPGALEIAAYSGQAVPPNLDEGVLRALYLPVLNSAGELALAADYGTEHTVRPTGTLLAWTRHNLVAVSESGDPTAGTNPGIESYIPPDTVRLNDAGQLMFSLDTKFGRVLVASTPNTLVTIAKKGQLAPGTEPGTVFSYVPPDNHAINNSGQITYSVDLRTNDAEEQTAIYVGEIGAEPSLAARSGDPLPGGPDEVILSWVETPNLNDLGEVVFSAGLSGTDVDSEDRTNADAILAGKPNNLELVAQSGDLAPDAGDGVKLLLYPGNPVINNQGKVAFRTNLTGVGINSSTDDAIYVGKSGDLKLVVREGVPVPGRPEGVTVSLLDLIFGGTRLSNTMAINDSGQVAFNAVINGQGGPYRIGVFTGDGIDLLKIAGSGDVLDNRVVESASIPTYSGGSDGRRTPLNELGQILYSVDFEDNSEGIYLFTPDLMWRGTLGDSQWDSSGNWTLSLNPGHVHDVSIGGESDLHILGPSADVTVKSLVIGEGNGSSKFELQANSVVTALEDFRIEANGTVTGNGKIAAELVHNEGLIDVGNSPGNLIVDGNFVQTDDGILRIEITDERAFDSLNVTGTAALDGSIEVMLDPDFAPRNGMYWDILSAESISLNAEVMHPAEINVELLADQFGSIDVLRVWSAPEPGAMATLVVGAGLVIAACGGRRSRLNCRYYGRVRLNQSK